MLYKLGIDNEFKISVFMGNDNPYGALWTLIGPSSSPARMAPAAHWLQWSNSVNNQTLEITAEFRKALALEDVVRFEHHITETWKSIVKQPYLRRSELLDLASHVKNISAKHEAASRRSRRSWSTPRISWTTFRDKTEVIDSAIGMRCSTTTWRSTTR